MTGPIIPAGEWPEWADRFCWDADGDGYFYGVAMRTAEPLGNSWRPKAKFSTAQMPVGWDWRVPVMRPVTLDSSVPAKPVAIVPTGHPTSVVQWLGPMPPQGTYLYTAPHQSPAIDLEQLREAFCLVLQDELDLEAADPEDPRHDDGRDEALRVSDRLLALIDGQANVRSSSEHSEDLRIARIIAEKIDEGRLDHPGFYKNGRLSEALRNILALIDRSKNNNLSHVGDINVVVSQPSKGEEE